VDAYLLTDGIPGLARLLFLVIAGPRAVLPGMPQIDQVMVFSVVRCGLGIWLILGARGIAQLLRKYGGKWRYKPEIANQESK
jgi:hypothetical protein